MTAPNVLDLVLGHAIRAPDALAILANNRTTSFAALARTAAGVAAALGCRGIAVDAVVAVQVGEPEAALTIMLGAMLGGRIVLSLDRDMPPAERARILDAAGAAALVADDHQALPDRITALRPDDLAGSGDPAAERRPGGDRLAQIVLSSGTSGPSSLEEITAFFTSLGSNAAIVIKAMAGGGGRGMRVVENASDLAEALSAHGP